MAGERSSGLTAPALAAAPALESVTCLVCGGAGGSLVERSPAQLTREAAVFRFVRCQDCGLVYLNPRVSAEAVGRYYDESYAPHRGEAAWGRWAPLVHLSGDRTDRARLRLLQRERRLHPEDAVLDVGCGRPTFLRLVRRATGARSVGVDFVATWCDAPQEWTGIELVQSDLTDLRLEGCFDVFTCWHVIEHLYAPLDTLRALRGYARPGAMLVVEVPDHDSLTRRLQGPYWGGYHTPRHTAAYTATTLRGLLERAGWRVQRQLGYGTFDPFLLWWLGRAARRGDVLAGDLSSRFLPFLAGKLVTSPVAALERWLRLGVQTAIARA